MHILALPPNVQLNWTAYSSFRLHLLAPLMQTRAELNGSQLT